ncbi:MAG TPA: response regulator, partial [Thermoguttaceae bacterium]|nr:response regulator [Thermoguttaceae bacterium]
MDNIRKEMAMPRTLLVVDDALIIRHMIKETVEPAGWTVVGEAANGQMAVQQYEVLRPQAVTLDLVMPEYDGLYALRGILAIDPSAKVLVVSALDQRSVLRESFKLGAFDFLVKPFDKTLLLKSLDNMVPAEEKVSV